MGKGKRAEQSAASFLLFMTLVITRVEAIGDCQIIYSALCFAKKMSFIGFYSHLSSRKQFLYL
jgi:hypothetical protein